MNTHQDVMYSLGRIETKLDSALETLGTHGPRIDKLEKRFTYQTGFTAALLLVGGAIVKYMPFRHL